MPTLPTASTARAALGRHHGAVQHIGEALRSGTIRLADDSARWAVAIWRHDPERRVAGDGGMVLTERLIFTVAKTAMPTALADGTVIVYVELGRAFIVEHIDQETSDHIAWRFEARRAPGSDPA